MPNITTVAGITITLATKPTDIGENAKICYGTKLIKDGGKDITSNLVHGHGHLAALRFAYMTVHISSLSVAAQNQLVRSKHLDFMVQSKRYVSADKGEFHFVMPNGLTETQAAMMKMQWNSALDIYKQLLADGVKKEDARAVLPANTSTAMNITGNLQAWNDFFKLRLNSHAQGEIRSIALDIFCKAQEHFPLVFTDKILEGYSK